MGDEEKIFMCKICDKIFSRNDHLRRHEMIHTGQKPFECDVCFKEFAFDYKLKRHSLIHIGKRYKCELCGKSFTEKYRLTRHQYLHMELKLFECHACKKSFTRNEQLRRHILTHDKSYKCKICEFSFTSNTDLKTHLLSHLDTDTYECDICNETFSEKEQFELHKTIHLGSKPYKCDICHIGVSRKEHLNRHKLNVHHEVKEAETVSKTLNGNDIDKTKVVTYSCEICSLTFPSELHMSVHMREKHRNRCNDNCLDDFNLSGKSDVCEASTSQHNILKISEEEPMEEGMPYSCYICDKTFTLKFSYDRHIKLKHQNKNRVKASEVYHYDDDLEYLDSDLSDSNLVPEDTVKTPPKEKINSIEITTLSCGICDKSFANSDIYIIHVWSHCPDLVEVCVKNLKIDSSTIHAILEDTKSKTCNREDTENVVGLEIDNIEDNYDDNDPCTSSNVNLFENKEEGRKGDTYGNSLQGDSCKDSIVFEDKVVKVGTENKSEDFCMNEIEDSSNEIISYRNKKSDTDSVIDLNEQNNKVKMDSFPTEDLHDSCNLTLPDDSDPKQSVQNKEPISKNKVNLITKSVAVKLNKCKLDWNKEFLHYVESSVLDDNDSPNEDSSEDIWENEENDDNTNDPMHNNDSQTDNDFMKDSEEIQDPNNDLLKNKGKIDDNLIEEHVSNDDPINETIDNKNVSSLENSVCKVYPKMLSLGDNDMLMTAVEENDCAIDSDVSHEDVIQGSIENDDNSIKNDDCCKTKNVTKVKDLTDIISNDLIVKAAIDKDGEPLLSILEPVEALDGNLATQKNNEQENNSIEISDQSDVAKNNLNSGEKEHDVYIVVKNDDRKDEIKHVDIKDIEKIKKESTKKSSKKLRKVETIKEEPEKNEETLQNRKFSCKLCNEKFAQKLELLQHKFTHLQAANINVNNAQVKDAFSKSADVVDNIKAEYICPVKSCSTVQTFKDLKSGAGVKHMITMHNIYPSKIIKSRLYFKKML